MRHDSGGKGTFHGGEGVIREIEFLADIHVGVLTERRAIPPYGLMGGQDGGRGQNLIVYPDGHIKNFGSKNSAELPKGSKIIIKTPGGGGYGPEVI
jgi:N-methylhydantoinase B/oxoprolinase/acetone carboxylase alpha subunit